MNTKIVEGIAQGAAVAIRGGSKTIENILIGDQVMTMSGYQNVLAAQHTGYRDTFELRTEGAAVLMTAEHPVLTIRDGVPPAFIALKDLNVGDVVARLMPSGHGINGAHTIILEPIISINAGMTMNVYDLKVEGEEHFTANTFIVHNCKHLLALREIIKKKHGI